MPLSPMDRLNVDEWDKMIDVNIKGVLNGVAAVLPYMKEQKSGQIINTSSVAGHKIFTGSAVYSATKFAVRALTEGLRMELKPYNIRTTIVRISNRQIKIMWDQLASARIPLAVWLPLRSASQKM